MSGVNQHVVGNVSFSPARPLPQAIADEVIDQMADSIVELTHELEESNARIAVLEEEQKILAKGFPSPAKAAVTEGRTGETGAQRPEPSPEFKQPARDALLDADSTPETLSSVAWATDVSGWPTYLVVNAWVAQKLERERDAYASHLNQVCEELGMGEGFIAVDAAIIAAGAIDKLERERDEARVQYRTTELLGMALVRTINEMKEERADLKAEIQSLRDQLCADKCRDKAAADRVGGHEWGNL